MQHQQILIVDDDPKVVKIIKENLEARGYELLAAGNGPDALNTIKTKPPDLVILDIVLPGIDGFEVCRMIRGFSKVPIIMLTALGNAGAKIRGLSLGADDYITKPFDINILMARIKAILSLN
jgi:DNA-binding response OmpR family regulator